MNVAGVLLLRFIGSLAAQRRGAGGLRRRLHGAVLVHHLDVGRPDGRRGDDRRAEPRRRQARARDRTAWRWPRGSGSAGARSGALFLADSRLPAGRLRHDRSARHFHRRAAAALPERVRACSSPWRSATPAGCRAPATRAARCTSRWSRRSACRSACARASRRRAGCSRRHLAGDRPRPLDACRAERGAFPAGPLAAYRRRHRAGAAVNGA